MDKALRVWNFQDKSSELISFFDDAPLAVSLHPSGLYLLVSFGEKVREQENKQVSKQASVDRTKQMSKIRKLCAPECGQQVGSFCFFELRSVQASVVCTQTCAHYTILPGCCICLPVFVV